MAKSMLEIHSPTRTLMVITLSIFISEFLVMLLVPFLPPISRLAVATIDSALLLALLSPWLYVFVFRQIAIHVSERDRAEEELLARHKELNSAYGILMRAQDAAIASGKLAALGRLTAGVSHEILNPLNVVTMRLKLMLNDPSTPTEMLAKLGTMNEQAERIVKITQDLLSYARQRSPERRPFDFNHAVCRTLDLLEYELRKENIAVDLKLEESLPWIVADENKIQQVVLNLLTNARDAMPHGGRLLLKTGLAQRNERWVTELRVEDTGIGINPENIARVFEPFFTTKPEGEGTGLGLSVCKGIVESHKGAIWAESEIGRGTAFIIELPLDGEEEIEAVLMAGDGTLIGRPLQFSSAPERK